MIIGLDHKEVRKVQFTGRSTYVLSLPKKWIEEMHIHAGDQVTLVRELDNSLSVVPIVLGPSESLSEVTAIILPNERSSTLKRKVVSMYASDIAEAAMNETIGEVIVKHVPQIR